MNLLFCLLHGVVMLLGTNQLKPSSRATEPLEVSAAFLSELSVDDADLSWRVSLRDPGESTLALIGRPKDSGPISVSQERLAALCEAVSREMFFGLREIYGDIPVDGPKRTMEIRLGRRSKKVTLYSIKSRMSKQESLEVDRAVRVWFAIMDCFHLPLKAAA